MKFSVICLTYKRLRLLNEAVFSVLQQTNQDFELLIINDNAAQRLHYNHPKVRIFNLEERFPTLGEKRNFGVANAKGEYIINLDDDDLFLPNYLETLSNVIGTADFLYPQRPILYFDNPKKIVLSPYPQTNTFVYRRSIAEQYKYDAVNFDELTPFYLKVKVSKKRTSQMMLLKPEQCGYVYRQDINEKRKYSMGEFKTETLQEQNAILHVIADDTGDIMLQPKWEHDYTQVIRENMRVVPKAQTDSPIDAAMKQYSEEWKRTKLSWENALKFVEAANSRGIFATIANWLNLSKNVGVRVSKEIYQQRHDSCFGNVEKGIPRCEYLRKINDKGHFCSSCGCGVNNLAKLDGDGYTKLHYPYLECPLKKPGFSNELKGERSKKNTFSIVITALNEKPEYLNQTIQSIRDTAGREPEIIIVDDCSDVPVNVPYSDVTIIRNTIRVGVGPSRHIGAKAAKYECILFTDAHMIFEAGWYQNACKAIFPLKPNVAYCGACLGLNSDNQELNKHRGVYYGAKLVVDDTKNGKILEGKWVGGKRGQDNYEIACMMGALYFVPRELYFKVRGFSDLKMWGSSEPCISTKIWLSGGEIRLLKNVRAGHIFRSSAPYSTGSAYMMYNKIRLAKTILPADLGEALIAKLPHDKVFQQAMQMIQEDELELEEFKMYYKSIFVRDIYWLNNKFDVCLPKE